MNMSGAKMSARLPTRFHDAGSITLPARVFGGGRPLVCFRAWAGSSDLDLVPLLVHVDELVLVATLLFATAPLLASGHRSSLASADAPALDDTAFTTVPPRW